MQPDDYDEFSSLLDAAYDLLGKTPQAKVISAGSKALFFSALVQYPLAEVRAGLAAHIQEGTFTPVPNDIKTQIEKHAAAVWVDANEAWAQVPKLESDAGILNQVTAAALAVAQPLIDEGDMIGGRVAFIKAYDTRVALAKAHPDPAQRVPAAWVSGGNQPQRFQDPHGERQMLLERGQRAGLLPAPLLTPSTPQLAAPSAADYAKFKQALAGLQMKSLPPPQAEAES